ncbi:glycoside hydrolase family 2 protein [bacterium]|nr:glycoside hydrolase family 2 protein [bacterium]
MPRVTTCIDADWRFHLGDVAGAEAAAFDDGAWRRLDAPHDWSIEGAIDEANPSGSRGGFFPGGIGWYRKTLDTLRDKNVSVEFDGVYWHSDVWVNGRHLGHRPSGYVGFCYDLTPYLTDGPNVLAVRVDNSEQPNSRWYTGSGITRHVWLTAAEAVHIAHWGAHVTTPEVSAEMATVRVRTTVVGDHSVTLDTAVLAPDGSCVGSARSEGRTDFDQSIPVPEPLLWRTEEPQLYTVRSRVLDGDELLDSLDTPFGIRRICFDPEQGFLLNDEPVKLRGVNEHHDLGCLGAAAPDEAVERRLDILQAMGCNAIRTAHNPPSPALLDLCDRMGFLVMDEAFDEWREGKVPYGYHRHFDEWAERDLRDMIRRDRNHPCVVLWSVGNEIREKGTPEGVETLEWLVGICHDEDPTRPVTCGCDAIHQANASGFAEGLDVVGYNGGGGSVFQIDDDHATWPDRRMLATEIPHTFQTRGVYRTTSWMRVRDSDANPDPHDVGLPVPDLAPEEVFPDVHPKHCSSYDNCSVRISARDSWRLTRDHAWFAGEFRWTGFDYLGESLGWPAKHWNFGVIDTCGFPKDAFYFYQSQWTTAPMVHLLPHWTWPGKVGATIPVWCYTNCEGVELYLNGRSQGQREMGVRSHLAWNVKYEPGELVAIGRRRGKDVARQEVHTAGRPAAVLLEAEGRALVHVRASVRDSMGRFVPTARARLSFEVEGDGKLLAVDNGDPLCHERYGAQTREAFGGLCLAIVQRTGKVRVIVRGEGLRTASIRL